MPDDPSYREARAELDAILAELEDDRIDIDALAGKARRAKELIRHCRARIADARMEVDRVVGALDDEPTAPDVGPDEVDG